MIYRLEVPRGPNEAPAIIKHCVRFGRRLRAHGIHNYCFPSLVAANRDGASILVGSRVVHLHDDGSYTQQLKPVRIDGNWHYDRQGMPSFRARSHARFLNGAAIDRRNGWSMSARAMLAIAAHDRISYSLEASR